MCVYIYIYVCVCVYIYIYIYVCVCVYICVCVCICLDIYIYKLVLRLILNYLPSGAFLTHGQFNDGEAPHALIHGPWSNTPSPRNLYQVGVRLLLPSSLKVREGG